MKQESRKSNFVFLAKEWPDLADVAGLAESHVHTDPESALVKMRIFTEIIVDILYDELRLRPWPDGTDLSQKLKFGEFRRKAGNRNLHLLDSFRLAGNKGAHANPTKWPSQRCNELLKDLHSISIWFIKIVTRREPQVEPFLPVEKRPSVDWLLAEMQAKERRIKELEEQILAAAPREASEEFRKKREGSMAVAESPRNVYEADKSKDEEPEEFSYAVSQLEVLESKNELNIELAYAIIHDIEKEIPGTNWGERLIQALESSPSELKLEAKDFHSWLESDNRNLSNSELIECSKELTEIVELIESDDKELEELCVAIPLSSELKTEEAREHELVAPILTILRAKQNASSVEVCFELNQIGYRVTGGVTRRALHEAKNRRLVSWSPSTTSWSPVVEDRK